MAKLQLGSLATRDGDILDTRSPLPQGEQGPQGVAGPPGTTGTAGVNGAAGTAATIAIGTVNTLAPGSAATGNNSGNASAATFNFGIPQGQQGIQGVAGITPVVSGTSTTSHTIGTGTKTLTTQADLVMPVGTYVRIANTATPTTYMSGPITSYSGTTLVINSQETSGSGTFTSWNISYTGTKGATGNTGGTPVINSTSTTSNTIGLGTKTFTTAAALNLSVGNPLRVYQTATPANWMYGLITAISGTSVTINATETSGSGTITAWTLALSGANGSAGTGVSRGARFWYSGTQSIPAAGTTAVVLNNTAYNEDTSLFNFASGNITVSSSGIYSIVANIQTGSSATAGNYTVLIVVNGAVISEASVYGVSTSLRPKNSETYRLNAGDIVGLSVYFSIANTVIGSTAKDVGISIARFGDSGTQGPVTQTTIADGSITSAKIADGTIVDADISATAAISASKIFGVPVIVKPVSGAYPARPTGADIVIWHGALDPGSLALNGDYWDDVD